MIKFRSIRDMLYHFGYALWDTDMPNNDFVVHTRESTTFFKALHSMVKLNMGGLMAINVSKKKGIATRKFMEIIQSLTKCYVEKVDINGSTYVVVTRQENRI